MIGTAVVLFVIGNLSDSQLVRFTETFLGIHTVAITLSDSLMPGFGLGCLLGFCSISAGVILWAYIKSQLPGHSALIFSLALLASIISAVVPIGLKLLQLQLMFSQLAMNFSPTAFSTKDIDFWGWGFGTLFFVCGIATISLLWISRWQERRTAISESGSKKRDIILVLFTVVILAGAFMNLVGFMCTAASL